MRDYLGYPGTENFEEKKPNKLIRIIFDFLN
jgi:hypothetical protein